MANKGNGRSDPRTAKVKDEMLACLPSLKAFAISLSGDAVRADDLVQQTVLQALAKLESFEPGTNMSAWLFTILRNLFRSEYRKRRREAEWDPEHENTLSFSTGMGDSAEHAYDFQQFLRLLACIPAEQADALIAVGYLGMSYEEAAERLDCPVGTIKSRVNRARDALGELLRAIATAENIDLQRLKTAARGVPKSHGYYPIAAAYEELYAAIGESNRSDNVKTHEKGAKTVSESEQAWQDLVASGALDDDTENLSDLLQRDSEDT